MENLPDGEKASKILSLIEKKGVAKTIIAVLIANIVPLAFVLLLFLDSNSKFKMINDNINKINNQVNNTINLENENKIGGVKENPVSLGTSTEFNEEDWIVENYKIDKEGYYCPTVRNFKYWSIWSKKKVPLIISEINIKLLVKKVDKTDKPPTISISYGEYQKDYAPKTYYRLSVFDDGVKAIRLYDGNDKSLEQDWLSEDPNLSNEVMISISPRSMGPDNRKIGINPKVAYTTSESTITTEFKPGKDFIVALPMVKVEDGNINKQIGIGTKPGVCFKVTSASF